MTQINFFNADLPNRSTGIFDGKSSNLLNWDDVRNESYLSLWKEMRGQFWVAEEVSMSQDQQHWVTIMSPEEKETYRLAIGQLAVLDSIATVYDLEISKYITDPAVKACYAFMAMMESIHNHSYTYVLSSFTSRQEKEDIFETAKTNPTMLKRNQHVLEAYNEFINNPTKLNGLKSIVANMVLEKIFFSMGFTFFFHLSRIGKMLSTQSLISMIFLDETLHGKINSLVVREILEENRDIDVKEFSNWTKDFIIKAVGLEKEWGAELYQSVPEVNLNEIQGYVEWTANMILSDLGLEMYFTENKKNPMAWINVYHPDNRNAIKTDFFEGRVTNYTKASEGGADRWADL